MERHRKVCISKREGVVMKSIRRIVIFVLAILAFVSPVYANSIQIQQISLATNDIIYDSHSDRIYASVPSRAGVGHGNTITTIDPYTGQIGQSVFVGSEPNRLAVSDDGVFLYTGLDGAGAVRRYDITTHAAGLQFALGFDPFLGTFFADDIAVVPGNHDVVAISRRNSGFSPRHEGVGIYDNGVIRPNTTQVHTGSDVIEFSANPGVLYGYNNETTEFGFRKIRVDGNGATETQVRAGLISGFGVDIKFEGGLVFSTSGRVINPDTLTIVGTYNASGPVAPDSASGLTYFVDSGFFSSSPGLKIFDRNTFVPTDTIAIPGINGNASDLVRFGTDGLAFRTSGDQVFLITGIPVAVPEPETWALWVTGILAITLIQRHSSRKSVTDLFWTNGRGSIIRSL